MVPVIFLISGELSPPFSLDWLRTDLLSPLLFALQMKLEISLFNSTIHVPGISIAETLYSNYDNIEVLVICTLPSIGKPQLDHSLISVEAHDLKHAP
jgi:hypothetical protein